MKQSDILDFIQDSPSPVTKREIGRALQVKGSEARVKLKKILRDLERESVIVKQPGGGYSVPDGLPSVAIIEVCDVDVDGDVFAKPGEWDEALQGPMPRISVIPDKKGHAAVAVGDRILARLFRQSGESYEAKPIRKLDGPKGRVIGVVQMQRSNPILVPTDKKAKYDFEINPGELNGAKAGDLAVGEVQPSRGLKRKKVRIVEVLGAQGDPKAISIISLHEAGLNENWPERVLKDTQGLKVPELDKRSDLRDIPLVTIDGADARDFDDAVFAEKDGDGFHLIVAIADVSHYVRTETPLDNEAQRRGNSTYFPDRVVPMLPEALSNDLCSLRPNEDRACLAVHMWIDQNGKLIKHKFVRGLMRSAARLIYEDVQEAFDKQNHELMSIINPLYEAFKILDDARQKRGALDLDLPEKRIVIDDKGNMTGVAVRERLDAHKMIEEFMVLANVAAAQALDVKHAPCIYRVHDRPSATKLDSAREFLESFNLSLPKGQVIQPKGLNHILQQAAKLPYSHLISTVILRTQSQAVYSPANIGHFGLALTKYAHFTSPIRRYADLLVHRSLIQAYGLGAGGLSDGEEAQLEELAQHISDTERTSMTAERSAVDRFTAAYLSGKIGEEFKGRITGVTRFGLFVSLDESGADGLVPMRSMGDDFYIHDEQAHALIGRRHGKVFQLGANVAVRLIEADGMTGSTVLELSDHPNGAVIEGAKPVKRPQEDRSSRPRNKAHKGKKKPRHKKRPGRR